MIMPDNTPSQGALCPVPAEVAWNNLVLRNITINDPVMSPGVIYGNDTNPMRGFVFEDVIVNNPGPMPWGDEFYACQFTSGVARGRTYPVPPCFSREEGN